MQFDDRLATVLRAGARTETAARTQYRQLLDLLGSMPDSDEGDLVEAARARLVELAEELPAISQSQILRSPDLRLRNRALLARLAQGEPQAAAAAMATARLSESDWLYLIPRLPLTARGFLRHRRDLPLSVRQVLERLGVHDLALPEPANSSPAPAEAGIGDIVRRIEAFQEARRRGEAAPRLPLEDEYRARREARSAAFDFATDAKARIAWADPGLAPMLVGMALDAKGPGALAQLDARAAEAFARRQPVRGGRATLAGPAAIEGEWLVDAAPAFDPAGRYTGYRGRMRRLAPAPARAAAPVNPAADRMRQVLHELRTPVGAIQGFAELIQQQMFGPAPNAYRALAAAVAVDAARLLAGFEEIDRLAKLETGIDELDGGSCDLREVFAPLLRRVEGALRPRSAMITLVDDGTPCLVPLSEKDALQLAWRLVATLAGALAPGEAIDLVLANEGASVTLRAELPLGMLDELDLFVATAASRAGALSAGMFGSGFTLRLARAEASAAGGSLQRTDDWLILKLPALTATGSPHSVERHA